MRQWIKKITSEVIFTLCNTFSLLVVNVLWNCVGSTHIPHNITWYASTDYDCISEFQLNSRFSVELINRTRALKISDVHKKDLGLYYCIAVVNEHLTIGRGTMLQGKRILSCFLTVLFLWYAISHGIQWTFVYRGGYVPKRIRDRRNPWSSQLYFLQLLYNTILYYRMKPKIKTCFQAQAFV